MFLEHGKTDMVLPLALIELPNVYTLTYLFMKSGCFIVSVCVIVTKGNVPSLFPAFIYLFIYIYIYIYLVLT